MQKKTLNSSSSLQQVFYRFKAIEKIQICKFKEEFERHISQPPNEEIILLKELKETFPEYVYKKIYPKFYKGLNYKHEKLRESW